MTERKFPSRKFIAQRIASVSKVESGLITAEYGCVPQTLAFTHGETQIQSDFQLRPVASMYEIRHVVQQIADKHQQELVQRKVEIENPEILKEELSSILSSAECCWIGYYTHNKKQTIIGHIFGVIPTANNRYARWNSAVKNHIATLSFDELVTEILDDRHKLFSDVNIFGFMADK